MTISFTIATRTCNQPCKKHDIARNRIQHGERSCALRAMFWTLNMATVQSLMWEIYKMHPYHIKEIKNQPRFKIFNLTLILTCNIHIQRILLGNCVRVRFFCTHDLLTYQKSKEWDFWYKNNDSVNTDHSTFYVALFTIYIPRLSSFCQHFTLIYVSNVLVNWVISIFCGQMLPPHEVKCDMEDNNIAVQELLVKIIMRIKMLWGNTEIIANINFLFSFCNFRAENDWNLVKLPVWTSLQKNLK